MKYDTRRNLERLQNDFSQVTPVLEELNRRMITEHVSQYPVFVATRQPLELGLPVINADKLGLYWHFRASHLEELVKKEVVEKDQLKEFKAKHEKPLEVACILVVPGQLHDARFAFIPFRSPRDN